MEYIGLLDSGVGGLSVLKRLYELMPERNYIFFGDTKNVPYGTKSRPEVLAFVDAAFKFLTAQNVSAIVVACNTATSVAVRKMREKYSLPIIGMEPALKVALDTFPGKKVLVAATAITVTGEKIHRLIERLHAKNLAELKALSKLVDFAERCEFNSADVENYLRAELSGIDFKNFSSLVLGCTHFNYFKDTLRKILPPHVKILDGNAGTVNELIRRTNLQPARSEKIPNVKFFYSGRLVTDAAELERLKTFSVLRWSCYSFCIIVY